MKRRFCVVLLVLLAFFALASGAQAAAGGVYVEAAVGQNAPAVVRPQTVKGYNYLFLPASTDLRALVLHFDGGTGTLSGNGGTLDVKSGEAFDLTALYSSAPSDGVYQLELKSGRTVTALRVMVSANTASLFLTSENPSAKGRKWVEQNKNNKASGQVCMLSPSGEVIYAGGMKQIKGRGNTTWTYYPKKPYQIKLAASADLMENGESAGTWVLLANYIDESLLHNRFTYDLAGDLNMAYSPHCRPVDLYYDGEYRGSYLLSEKTEVKTNRVEVEDLEKAIEKANPDVDFDKLTTASGKTPAGNPCQYVSGITLPGDFSGGYLLELDYRDRAKEEVSWFASSSNIYFVSKSPEYLPKAAIDYISSYWQDCENALRSGGVNPRTGKAYSEYMDVTSLAKMYLIEELSQDVDAFLSSCFFYKDAGGGPLYAGPVWDFDSCYGSYSLTPAIDQPQVSKSTLGRLLQSIPSFRKEVRRCWDNEMYPLLQRYISGQGAHSISAYGAEIAASQRMDAVLWPQAAAKDYSAALSSFRSFVTRRAGWMDKTIHSWTVFSDVPANSWYSDAVLYVSNRGLLSGTSQETFSPGGLMTRAMAVTVLHRLAGTPAPDGEVSLSDVDGSAWYSRAAAWAVSAGIATDFGDGSFRPDEPVSRQELAALFYRFAMSWDADVSSAPLPEAYTDRDSIDDSAADALAWAVHHGLILGTSESTLSPTDNVTRAQVAIILQRFDTFLTT